MNTRHERAPGCLYCGRTLQYVAHRWFGHNVFACSQCGDFPDFRAPAGPPNSAKRGAAGVAGSAGNPENVGNRGNPANPGNHRLPHVLLVDDSVEQQQLYAAILESRARVVTTSRGESALALAEADPPDVIVLDVMMPGMDGWETCERLKADPATSAIPVIMLTSLDGVDVPARARQAGASAVLMKPCPAERLVLTIDAARRSLVWYDDMPPPAA